MKESNLRLQQGAKRASKVDYTWGSQLKVFPSVNYMSQTTEQSGDGHGG